MRLLFVFAADRVRGAGGGHVHLQRPAVLPVHAEQGLDQRRAARSAAHGGSRAHRGRGVVQVNYIHVTWNKRD